jgi:two-component system chemotaxis response regulator CheB
MGKDGADSLKRLHDEGALCLIENRESSTVFGMPGEAEALGAYDRKASSDDIPQILIDWTNKTTPQP